MSPEQNLLSSGERKGLIVLVVAASFSVATTSFLLLFMIIKVLQVRQPGSDWIYPITLFYLVLLFWEALQGIAWLMTIKWITQGSVVMGTYCVTQAILKQLHATGTALSIIAMSCCILHDHIIDSMTNLSLKSGYIGLAVMVLTQAILIGVPNGIFHGPFNYYGISGLWCYISDPHFVPKIVTHYLWYWSAAAFSFLTALAYFVSAYLGKRLPVGFLWIGFPMKDNSLLRLGPLSIDSHERGNPKWGYSCDMTISRHRISIILPIPIQYFDQYYAVQPNIRLAMVERDQADPNNLNISPVTTLSDVPPEDVQAARRAHIISSLKLLMFPLSYMTLVIPVSVVRFIQFYSAYTESDAHIGSGVAIFVSVLFALTGFVEFLLFVVLRPAFGVDF